MRRLLLLLALVLLPACEGTTTSTLLPTPEDELTLYVASYTRTCMGMYEMECMLIKEEPDEEWGNFYSQIEGFAYEPGYEYVLRVAVTEVPNPPADGASRTYRLVQLVSKTRVP